MELDMTPVTIGPYTFTLTKNTLRGDNARRVLLREYFRYLEGPNFETLLDEIGFQGAADPYYFDIVGCTVAIDNDPKHPVLRDLLTRPQAWEDLYYSMPDDTRMQQLVAAIEEARRLNPHWYVEALVSTDDPDAKTMKAGVAALDPNNESDEPGPSQEQMGEAIERLTAKATKEAAEKGFLDRTKS
jgi:hypothetical protein